MHEVSIHNLAHAETTKSNLANIDLEDQKHVFLAVRELPVIRQGGLGAGVSLTTCHFLFQLDSWRDADYSVIRFGRHRCPLEPSPRPLQPCHCPSWNGEV